MTTDPAFGDGPAVEFAHALLARCRFPPAGSPVVCAVSGGADSLALLVLARAASLDVTAVHVDHGLRPGSAHEAEVVAAAAVRFGAGFRAEQVDVDDGPNLEARARAARYEVLPPGVLTGHTADDQAETVLLNLLRGSGLDGLSGMRPNDRVTRPLLGIRRSETAEVCAAFGLTPVQDPSNHDARHLRNQVRHELLPLLDRLGGRDAVAVLARQAELLAEEAALLDELAAALDPTDAKALAGAVPALARRAVRRWLTPVHGGRPPDSAEVERVLAVARGEAVACELVGGARIERHAQRLRIRAASADPGGLR